MIEPQSPRSSRRSNADYRWTRPKMMAFLRALVPTLSVAEAARSVGMSRQSAYRLRARLGPAFAQLWDEGLAIGLDLRKSANDAAGGSTGRMSPPARPAMPRQGDIRAAQGDNRGVTLSPQDVALAAQGYGRRGQADALRAQGDAVRPQGDA